MTGIALPREWLTRPTGRFLRHLAEMIVAMFVGMLGLGAIVTALLASQGYADGLRPYPELAALAMTLEMTIGMAAWMLIRRHRRAIVAEMSGAMALPAFLVVGLCVVHVLPGSSAPVLTHVGMYGAMLGVMVYRRADFTMDHGTMDHGGMDHGGMDHVAMARSVGMASLDGRASVELPGGHEQDAGPV